MKQLSILLITIPVTLSACAGLQRAPGSGYAYRANEPTFSRDRRIAQFDNSARQLGLSHIDELDSGQAEEIELRVALNKAERNIESSLEKEQYYTNKPYMRNDWERLQFLRLGTYDERQQWLSARGIDGRSTTHPAPIQALIDINDITVGMTKQAVRDSWGEPESIEVAGNPIYGNERWYYTEQVSSEEGYQTERRLIYFESGRVIGWKRQ